MRALARAQVQSGHRETVRNPATCAALAISLSAVAWIGLLWAAVKLYG